MVETELVKEDFYNSLLFLDKLKAREILKQPSNGLKLVDLIEKVVTASLGRIGSEWEEGIVSLSQVYMAGRICEEIVDEILPPASFVRKHIPKTAIVTFEDYHVLGKRIVYSILRASGFELDDWGIGMDINAIVKKVKNSGIKVLLVSTLMLNSALHIKDLILKLRKENQETKVIVGGAPFLFDDALWKEVGAFAMGANASDAIMLLNNAGAAEK